MRYRLSKQTPFRKNLFLCLIALLTWPELFAHAQTPTIDFKIVPVRSDHTYRIIYSNSIHPNKIITSTGSRIWFELYYSNWMPELLQLALLTIDAQFYSNGVGDPIAPAFENCASDEDCATAFDDGSQCATSGTPPNLYGLNTCRPGFITKGRNDDIPLAHGGPFDISAVKTSDPYISFVHAVILDTPKSDPRFDVYGGTLVVDVPAGASGLYTLNFTTNIEPNGNSTSSIAFSQIDMSVQSAAAFIEIGDLICCDGFECSDVITGACEISGGVNVGSCDTDCNGNGDPDICELTWFVQQDCNNNDQLDECDIDKDPSLDCNMNGAIDACEIAHGSLEDCDNNDNPDECDILKNPLLDCNHNGYMDNCDVLKGRSDDCNTNNIPDDCEGLLTLGADCNGNGTLDSCDITDNFSFDVNADCVPDECEPTIAPFTEPDPLTKSRYLSFIPTNAGCSTAVRVTLSDLPDFPSFAAQYRWLGQPQQSKESPGSTVMYTNASLQCNPYFMDWSTVGLVHAYGSAVVPDSQYDIQLVADTCADLSDPDCYTDPLTVRTGKWGDVIAPFFEPGGSQQPSIADVLAIVDKWLGLLNPHKTQAQLQPNIINPSVSVGIVDILKCVDAWLGSSYPFTGPQICEQ